MASCDFDTRAWNLSLGALVVAACGPGLAPYDEGTDGMASVSDSTTTTSSSGDPTMTTSTATDTSPGCQSHADCPPNYLCESGTCVPEPYCDDGCCYDGCCYEYGCGYECYSDGECGPGGLCRFGYCEFVLDLTECAKPPPLTSIPLPDDLGFDVLSLAFVDADGDDARDLVVGRKGEVLLVAGQGASGFTNLPIPANFHPIDLLAADVNGDWKDDLVIAGTNEFRILVGDGNGNFTAGPSTAVFSPARMVALDWNGDGHTDVASIGAEAWVHVGDGTGQFFLSLPLSVWATPSGIAAGAFTADPQTDLALHHDLVTQAYWGGQDGEADAELWSPYTQLMTTLIAGDFVAGGTHELVAASTVGFSSWTLLEAWTNSLAQWQATAILAPSTDVGSGDVNGDGTADIVLATSQGASVVLTTGLNLPLFDCVAHYGWPFSEHIAVGDFDGDGRADIAVAGGSGLRVLGHPP